MRRNTVFAPLMLAGLLLAPLANATAQSCGALADCFAISGVGLVFFGRDNVPSSAFSSGTISNSALQGTNSFDAFQSFKSYVSGETNSDGLGAQTFDGLSNGASISGNQAVGFTSLTGSGNNSNSGTGVGVGGPVNPLNGTVQEGGTDAGTITRRSDDADESNNNRYAVSGSQYLRDADDWTLSFGSGSTDASAVGLFGVDVAESGLDEALDIQIKSGSSTLTSFIIDDQTANADGSSNTTTSTCSWLQSCGGQYCFNFFGCSVTTTEDFDSGNLFFFAFVATSPDIQSVVFNDCTDDRSLNCNSNGSDVFAFDNVYASGANVPNPPPQVTPEPGSMSLLALGLAGLAARRRRRKV